MRAILGGFIEPVRLYNKYVRFQQDTRFLVNTDEIGSINQLDVSVHSRVFQYVPDRTRRGRPVKSLERGDPRFSAFQDLARLRETFLDEGTQ